MLIPQPKLRDAPARPAIPAGRALSRSQTEPFAVVSALAPVPETHVLLRCHLRAPTISHHPLDSAQSRRYQPYHRHSTPLVPLRQRPRWCGAVPAKLGRGTAYPETRPSSMTATARCPTASFRDAFDCSSLRSCIVTLKCSHAGTLERRGRECDLAAGSARLRKQQVERLSSSQLDRCRTFDAVCKQQAFSRRAKLERPAEFHARFMSTCRTGAAEDRAGVGLEALTCSFFSVNGMRSRGRLDAHPTRDGLNDGLRESLSFRHVDLHGDRPRTRSGHGIWYWLPDSSAKQPWSTWSTRSTTKIFASDSMPDCRFKAPSSCALSRPSMLAAAATGNSRSFSGAFPLKTSPLPTSVSR